MPQFNYFIASVKSFTNALKNGWDKTHPCFNPVFTSNHFTMNTVHSEGTFNVLIQRFQRS